MNVKKLVLAVFALVLVMGNVAAAAPSKADSQASTQKLPPDWGI